MITYLWKDVGNDKLNTTVTYTFLSSMLLILFKKMFVFAFNEF